MLRPSRLLHALCCLAALALCGRGAVGDDAVPNDESEEASFQRVAGRYLDILRDRPRQGVAFERWYRHYLDAGRLDELIASLERDGDADDFATQMLLGFVAERRGDPDRARAAYAAAGEMDPEAFVAPYSLGILQLQAGRYEAAAECLSRALACEASIEETLEVHQQAARAYLRLDRRDEALSILRNLSDQFPGDARIQRQLAEFLDAEGELEQSLERWERVAALPDQDRWYGVEANMAIADLRVRLEQPEAAVALLDETLREARPGSWLAEILWDRIRQIFQTENDARGFVRYCRERVGRRPEDVDGRLQLARAVAAAGNVEAAVAELRSAAERAPGRRDVHEELCHQLVLSGRFEDAVAECETLVKQNPDDADLLARLGELELRLETGDGAATERAVAAWRRLAEIRADDPLYTVRAAELCREALRDQGRIDSDAADEDRSRAVLMEAAEELYREPVARAPENGEHYEYLGEFLHEQGRRDDAVAAFAQLAGVDATADQWQRLGEVYASFGYLEEAVAALDTAIARRPDEFDWRVLRFDLLLRQEAFDRADGEWRELHRHADTPERQQIARERRLRFLRTADRGDEAIERLESMRKDETATAGDLWILALLLSERWRDEEAREAFEAALPMAPGNVELLRDYARVLEYGGNLGRAVSLLRRIVELDARPQLQDYERLASLELRLGDDRSARETIEQLRQLAPDRQATYVLRAELEFQTNAPEAGLEALRRAVQLAPRDIGIRARLADALARHGKPADAVEHYWRCFELSDDLDEQRSLVTAMCTIRSGRGEQIVERIRRLRGQAEETRTLTLCITAALRSMGRFDEARRELESLRIRNGRDLEVLRELTAIAVQQNAWSDAADYQAQVAAITEQSDDVRVLLRYYRSAGRHDDATQLWTTLLQSDDPQVYLDEVDRMLRELALDDAASLTEIGLSKAPDDWRLHLRAAVVRIVRREYEPAATHFDAAADATLPLSRFGPTNPAAGPARDDSRPELRTAKSELRKLDSLFLAAQPQRYQQQQLGRSLQAFRFPDNADDGHVAAVIGAYRVQNDAEWIVDRLRRGETDRRFWRHLIWAYAATDALAANKAFVDRYIERLPHDTLPHLARLEQARNERSVRLMSAQRQAAEIEGLLESYHWIVGNRPRLKAELDYKFGTDMLLFSRNEEAVTAFIDCLTHPSEAVRADAAISLRSVGAAGERSVPHLIERLSDGSPNVAIQSAATLGTLGTMARSAIPALVDVFRDDFGELRQEAALALARIGAESIPALQTALRDENARVRLGAIIAMHYLGRRAVPTMPDVIRAVHDEDQAVRRRAVMVLANFGTDAQVAVPDLMECLNSSDASLQVDAAATLAGIGPPAQPAVPVLLALLDHDERRVWHASARALWRIAPDVAKQHLVPILDAVGAALADIGTLDVGAGDWPQWGGWSGRNNTPGGVGIPASWNIETGWNVKWQAPLGSQTYGNPSVANGKVFVGTNNEHGYISRYPKTVDLGVMLCFDEQTGSFLWQYSSPKLAAGMVHDWPYQGMPSTPVVDGDRLWAVTNRCEVVCLDTEGFMDGENDGPFTREVVQNGQEADVVWTFDMMGRLGVAPHNMSTCCIVTMGGKLFVCTSNGVDESHVNIPAPQAPSFIAMDRETGAVLWTDNSPGANILHGQWASPTWGVFGGQPQIIFPGGDGWLYSFDPEGDGEGHSKLLWKFDANPKEALYSVRGRSERNHMIGFACSYDGLLYFAVGEDPEHGEGDGHLWCLNPAHRTDGSDVSAELAVDAAGNLLPQRRLQAVDRSIGEQAVPNPDSAVVWHYTGHDVNGNGKLEYEEQMHRGLSTPAIKDDLLYIADFSGIVHCLDAQTGVSHWTYDMFSQSWGSALVVDDKVYVGNEEGTIVVFEHGPTLNMLAENDMRNSVYTTPIVANNVLFITNKSTLFAIAAPEGADAAR